MSTTGKTVFACSGAFMFVHEGHQKFLLKIAKHRKQWCRDKGKSLDDVPLIIFVDKTSDVLDKKTIKEALDCMPESQNDDVEVTTFMKCFGTHHRAEVIRRLCKKHKTLFKNTLVLPYDESTLRELEIDDWSIIWTCSEEYKGVDIAQSKYLSHIVYTKRFKSLSSSKIIYLVAELVRLNNLALIDVDTINTFIRALHAGGIKCKYLRQLESL